MKHTKRRMTAFLPPTPCTTTFRDKAVAFAKREGRSLADVQREALTLFLSQNDMNCIDNDTVKTVEQAS